MHQKQPKKRRVYFGYSPSWGRRHARESVARTPLISVDPEAERPGPEMGPGYNVQGLPPVIYSVRKVS